MKKLMLMMMVVVFVMMGGIVGCESVSDEEWQEKIEYARGLREDAGKYQELLDDLSSTFGEVREVNSFPLKISDEDWEDWQEDKRGLQAKIDRIEVEFGKVIDSIASRPMPEGIGSDDFLKRVQGLAELIGSSAPATSGWNPYAGVISLSGLALSGILGLFLKKKGNESKANRAKYQAHKEAVEEFSREKPDESAELYKKIGEKRSVHKVE